MSGVLAVAGSGPGGSPVTVSVPATKNAVGSTSTITTTAVAATPSGGSGTYPTYSWALSNQTGTKTVTAQTPAASSTTFRITGSVGGDNGVCSAVCTVTDSLGAVGVSNTCTVTITNVA